LTDLSQELVKVHVRKQADDFEERRQYQLRKQEKHQTPSKVWMEKAANTDYEVCFVLFFLLSFVGFLLRVCLFFSFRSQFYFD